MTERTMPYRDPFNLTAYQMAALAGGLLWGMVKVFATVFAPTGPVGRRDVLRALVEAVFSIVAALISAAFVSPAIVVWAGVSNEQMTGLLYMIVGLAFWQSAPLLILTLNRWLPNLMARLAMVFSGNKR